MKTNKLKSLLLSEAAIVIKASCLAYIVLWLAEGICTVTVADEFGMFGTFGLMVVVLLYLLSVVLNLVSQRAH